MVIDELGVFLAVVETQTAGLFCYPNPFSDEIRIGFEAECLGADEISIYDLMGRKVFAMPCKLVEGRNEFTINPSLTAGMYLLKVGGCVQRIVRF